MTDATSLTFRLAELIHAADPAADAAVMRAARNAILDWLACAIAGSRDRSTETLVKTFGTGTHGPAFLIGRPERTDVFTAALINAHAGHVLDYDDVHSSVRGHPTTVILPALLAEATATEATAEEIIAAYVVGLEVMARLGRAIGSTHYEKGFHATATLGPIGAAAALARILKLDARATAVALGIAATQSAGLRLQFGHDVKPLHAGFAARAGLTAARLAADGFDGAPDFLDGPIDFLSAFGFGSEDRSRVLAGWDSPEAPDAWQILTPGLVLKLFPCCTASHPVAIAGLELRREFAPAADAIREMTITFPRGGDAALITGANPKTGIDARFSAEYVLATALIDGRLSLSHFDDRPVRPDLAAIASRASRRYDEAAPRLSSEPATRFVIVDITLADGRTLSRQINGLPSLDDPTSKFLDAAEGRPEFSGIPALVGRMTSRRDLTDLLQILGARPISGH